jgi:UDP-glucose 4-epimerase
VYAEGYMPDHVYVHDTMADSTKIQDATGWEPRISFEEGLERVCSQYLQP